ncbi:MAG: hypothetical protein A3G93_05615 [Nitrospinae bacterium RIFCSPLOWO2_12_FULL_45_22]|nr:MAG: hypothetical protein A3G93_05615 [Nitrospinae bacterium RIFCSPLOWO2_12_FULL_45_22]
MSRIFVPSSGPGDWRCLLADPEKHWVRRRSARTLAHCWEDTDGFPPEVQAVLKQHPALAEAEPLLIFPEWKVALPGGSTSSQNDAWVLAKNQTGLISIAVEGKVEEPFDKTLAEWKADSSLGKEKRLSFLTEILGFSSPIPDSVRYQLVHRTASAVIEAQRFGAQHAVMLVHSFSHNDEWHSDFAAFVSLFGHTAQVGRLVSATAATGLPLHLAWVHGDERFLDA